MGVGKGLTVAGAWSLDFSFSKKGCFLGFEWGANHVSPL